ncbi:MAG: RNA pyrophosphohydrolase, partial [Pseudomonadota bacterium]|nr:RNA pyrophosphohydrolase [Pseudomonadota bacterium]
MKTYNSIVCPGVYVIDADGFRANVGIVICNKMGQVFWA